MTLYARFDEPPRHRLLELSWFQCCDECPLRRALSLAHRSWAKDQGLLVVVVRCTILARLWSIVLNEDNKCVEWGKSADYEAACRKLSERYPFS